jgi:hypothetical protein
MLKEVEVLELRKIVRECQELCKCQGWVQLGNYAAEQIKHRESQQALQATGMDDLVKKEFVNGELSGIRLFLAMPELIIADFEEQLMEDLEEKRDATSSADE